MSNIISAKYSENPIGQSRHYHDCHQILFIVSGTAEVCVDNKKYIADSGTLIIFSRFEHHSINVISDEYKRYAIQISPDIATNSENYLLSSVLVNRVEGFENVIKTEEYGVLIENLIKHMTDEYSKKDFMRDEMLDLIFREFLIVLHRMVPWIFSNEKGQYSMIVQQVQKRFEKNYKDSFTLATLADEFHISPSYLSHIFKKVTGYSPMVHLQACRISAAKRYLTKTNMIIKEVVYNCGFSDESNFCRLFKRETGMSPTEFRNKYTENIL